MNKGLFGLSVLMIIFGAVSGFYIVSLFGVLLLIPSVASGGARRPPPTVPAGSAPTGQRISPPPVARLSANRPPAAKMDVSMVAVEAVTVQSYSQPLFPGMVFPSIGLITPALPAAPTPAPAPQQGGREDLVDALGILVLLKLLSG